MKSVCVVMSTYNATVALKKQLKSIFNQRDVLVKLIIRDDCSTNNTIQIIKSCIKQYPHIKVKIIKGRKNLGYAKSFEEALKFAPQSDYYAFSDQDDVWMSTKLKSIIDEMDSDKKSIPKLGYSKMIRCTSDLKPCNEQVKVLKPKELSKGLVLTQTFNYGAATVINDQLRKLALRSWPNDPSVPHDLWVGILGYWFGRIYYLDENTYYWIRYNSSVTGAGTKRSGMYFRFKETLNGKSYPNTASYLYNNYQDLLTDKDKKFLVEIMNYQNSAKAKMKLLFDTRMKRSSIKGTLVLKYGILRNMF